MFTKLLCESNFFCSIRISGSISLTTEKRTYLSSAWAVKKFNFKNPRWWTTNTLERPVLHHHEISRFFDFQDGACLPSGIVEIETLTAMHFRGTFCIITPNL